MQRTFSQERRFIGLDLYHPPSDAEPGYLQQADNVYVDGGELVTRPGKQGMFTTPLGHALYAPLAFVKDDLNTNLLFISDGKLYQTQKGSASYSEIKLPGSVSFTLDGPNVFMTRVGKFAYIVDGASELYRVNISTGTTATAGTVTGQDAPDTTFTASLTNLPLDPADDAGKWSSFPTLSSTSQMLLNRTLTTTEGASTASHWLSGGDSIDYHTPAPPNDANGTSVLLDAGDDPEWIDQEVATPTYSGNTIGRGRVYKMEAEFLSAGIWNMIVIAESGADTTDPPLEFPSTQIAQIEYKIQQTASTWSAVTKYFSFTGLTADPTYVRARIYGPASNPGNNFIDNVQLTPVDVRLKAENSTSGTIHVSAKGTAGQGGNLLGGCYLKRDYTGSPFDYSFSNIISFSYNAPATSGQLPLRLGFQKSGDPIADIKWSNPVLYSADGSYFYCDVSTVPADVRAETEGLYVQIISDLPDTVNCADLFTFGPITAAGNLSVGYADYTYVYTEAQDNGGGDVIESDPSPVSSAIQANGLKAVGQFTIPDRVNSGTNYYYVYRLGGVYSDGVGRLVAKAPYSSGDQTVTVANFYGWDHSTRQLIDNTPDSGLLLATTLITGRGTPPIGARCLCEWQGRLWLAKGSTLYSSWLINSETVSALYFNNVNLPDDPYGAVKGVQFSVGGNDNDPIQQLIPLSTALIVLKQRSLWMVTGFDAGDFALSSHLLQAGVGCIAPRAAVLLENKLWFLGANGVYRFDGGDDVEAQSLFIEKLLNPAQTGGAAITSAAYKLSAMIYHGRRLYLFAPGPGDSANTVAYVWDSRQQGWTRFLQMNVTGAATLSSGTDTDDIYLTGLDGQMYQLSGSGDTATPVSGASPVAFTIQSRGFGQEGDGDNYWRQNRPTRLYANVTTQESTPLTLGVAASGSAASFAVTYTVNGLVNLRLKIGSDVRGDVTSASLSGSTVTPTRVTAFALDSAEGRPNG